MITAKKKDKARSELLTLLNSRKAWEGKPYKHPLIGPTLQVRIEEAVRCAALLDNSNPYAAARVRLYLNNGYCLPSETLKDCKTLTALRAKEPKGLFRADTSEAQRLARIKQLALEAQRRADADKAWNQFNSQQYLADKDAA